MGMFHHHGNGKGHRHGGPKPSGIDRESLRGMQALKRLADIKDRREREQLERGLDLGLAAAPSVNDRTISTFSRGEQPDFAGINTFLKAPYCENVRDVGKYDVAFLGAPFDIGTTYRTGHAGSGRRASAASRRSTTPTTSSMGVDLRESSPSATSATSSSSPPTSRRLRPDRPGRRAYRPRAGRLPRDHRRRPLDRLSHRARLARTSKEHRHHPFRPPHRHAGEGHGRADAHDAVVPCHQHPERPAGEPGPDGHRRLAGAAPRHEGGARPPVRP